MKIIKNDGYGAFQFSQEAYTRMIRLGVPYGKFKDERLNPKTGTYDIENPKNSILIDNLYLFDNFDEKFRRTDPRIIKVVEEFGEKASGDNANLIIIEIPDNIKWEVDYCCDDASGGRCEETIREKHRKW